MEPIGAPGRLRVDGLTERQAQRAEVEPCPTLVAGLGHVVVSAASWRPASVRCAEP